MAKTIYVKGKNGQFAGSLRQNVPVPTGANIPPRRPAHPDDTDQRRVPPPLAGSHGAAYSAYLKAVTGSVAASLPRPSTPIIVRTHDGSLAVLERPLGSTVVRDSRGMLHHPSRPAITQPNGTREWWRNGALHRGGDQPAIEHADGTCEWWRNGALHRGGDQPAIVYPDGRQEWFRNGEQIAYQEPGRPRVDLPAATAATPARPKEPRPSTSRAPNLGSLTPLNSSTTTGTSREARRQRTYQAIEKFLRLLQGLERMVR